MARKSRNWGGMIYLPGHSQVYAIYRGTKQDFMAKTNITYEYVGETGNVEDLKALDEAGDGVLLYCPEKFVKGSREYVVVPKKHERWENHAARMKERKDRREEDLRLADKWRIEREEAKRKRLEELAQLLYSFEDFNASWEDALEETQSEYLRRAKIVKES